MDVTRVKGIEAVVAKVDDLDGGMLASRSFLSNERNSMGKPLVRPVRLEEV
jgi:hypothetical protein